MEKTASKKFNRTAAPLEDDLESLNAGRGNPINWPVREFYRKFAGGEAQAGMRLLPGMPIVYPKSKDSILQPYISELTH